MIFGRNGEKLESTMDKMITDKMTINLDVFMEDIIVSNMNDTLVVTIKGSSKGCGHTQILKNPS